MSSALSSSTPGGPAYQPERRQNQITLASEGVPGPAARYVSADEALYVRIKNAVAGLVVTVRARLQNECGLSAPQEFVITPTTDRSETFRAFPLGEGYLLSVAAFASTGSPLRGQTWIELGLVRAGNTGVAVVDVMLADYLTTAAAVAWPGAQERQSTEGPGVLRSITGTNPAAGVEISETVPTNARWRLRSFRAQLVTSAVAANRRVHLILDDGATILLDLAAADVQAATLTRNYNSAWCGFARAAQDNEIYLPLPYDVWLPQGSRVRTATTALDAGDNWGAPQLQVEELVED